MLTLRLLLLFNALLQAAGEAGALSVADPPAVSEDRPDFESRILPLLTEKCFDCHGPETQESHLRLDRKTAMLRGGDSGEPAIVVRDSANSHLIHLVEGTEAGKVMPPQESDRLTVDEIRLLRTWIDQGADWPGPDGVTDDLREKSDHWSFQPVRDHQPPELNSTWVRNGIDAFVLQKLDEHSLTSSPEATRAEIIRRMYLDMLGLPPTPDEVQTFVGSADPQAYVQLVDRVLASPHYGERWARHWLDLVRFAETNGYETNRERPNAWPYRDYVIRSLNEDKPYDQFLKEQLAGDAMGVPEATAYLVAGPYDLVKSPDVNLTLMQRQNELDDMIHTTGTAFLGLTLGCARCHNHKFDPIRQSDYYSFQAIFAGVQHGERVLPLSDGQQQELSALNQHLEQLRERLKPFVRETVPTRPAVNSRGNEEHFKPVTARFVRFTIAATNASEPCLDELEIYSGTTNVALSAGGAIATCSSALPGYEIHKLEHVNDGQPGNSRSWISNEPGRGWVQIELPQRVMIDRIVWSRDREGTFSDRLATEYVVEVAAESGQWAVIASSADRIPVSQAAGKPSEYEFSGRSDSEKEQGLRWLAELNDAEKTKYELLQSATVYAGLFEQPGPTHRLFRGEPLAKRETVVPDTVEVLGSLNLTDTAPEQKRRVALADWIASTDNPLTPRVIVNRLWQFHFGRGLVSTPGDFGASGAAPSHPELLDWLSIQLIRHGWSLKHVHRLILQSATYRQSSRPRPDALLSDGDAQWWWRFPPRRLEAEPIRDSILSVAGVLDLSMSGPGFSGFQIEMENVRHYFPKQSYGPADWRRMIYMTRVRLEKDSVFGIFDCPDAATSVAIRSRSTTPLQALNLFNSPFMLQQSRLFADRLQRNSRDDPMQQIVQAFWLCFGREPDPAELADSGILVSTHGLTAFCRAMLNSNEFVFVP